jgi:hypothetical protein
MYHESHFIRKDERAMRAVTGVDKALAIDQFQRLWGSLNYAADGPRSLCHSQTLNLVLLSTLAYLLM